MRTAIYPGSFDPVTYGHIDIIRRSAQMVDKLVVAVLNNSSKTPLFSVDERVNMLKEVCMDLPNVKVESYSGLLAEYAEKNHTEVIIRGLRAVSDFEYELQIAQTNHKISPSVDTIFLTTSLEYSYLSSSIVREVAAYGGDIHHFVPDFIAKKVYERAGEKANGNK